VTAERWGLGRLEWRMPAGGEAEVLIDTLDDLVGLRVPAGVTVHRHRT
jgi:hypothetical protein